MIQKIILVILLLISPVLFSSKYIQAAWSPPGSGPTASNTEPPINTSSEPQVKQGPISVDGLTSYANNNHFYGAMDQRFTIRPGYKGVDQTANYTTLEMPGVDTLFISDNLEVSEKVMSDQYCDQSGNNCTSSSGLSGPGFSTMDEFVARSTYDRGNLYVNYGTGNSQTALGYQFCTLTEKSDGGTRATREMLSYDGWGTTHTGTERYDPYNGTSCQIVNLGGVGGDWTLTANARWGTSVRCRMACFR